MDRIPLEAPKPQKEGLMELKPWTMDTGACDTVGDPADSPEAEVQPSEDSKAGRGWNGPGGERIPCLGKFQSDSILQSGAEARTAVNAAPVRQPLMAISNVCKEGHGAWMNNTGEISATIPSGCPELAEMRRLIRQCTTRLNMFQQNGVYKMRHWAPAGSHAKNQPGFAGRGK